MDNKTHADIQAPRLQKTDLKTQVKDALIDYIRKLYQAGTNKLPREEELAVMLGVSRITIRGVLEEMAAEGTILRRHGKGTFINPAFFEMKASFNPVMSFREMIHNSGYSARIETLSCERETAGKEVADALRIDENSMVLVRTKVFYADQHICAFVVDIVPMDVIGEEHFDEIRTSGSSMFDSLHQITGRKVTWDKVEIDVVHSRDVEQIHKHLQQLGGKDKAYLTLRGVNYDSEDKIMFYSVEYVDTSILKFTQIRKRFIIYN